VIAGRFSRVIQLARRSVILFCRQFIVGSVKLFKGFTILSASIIDFIGTILSEHGKMIGWRVQNCPFE
jgi:hypothetical protein